MHLPDHEAGDVLQEEQRDLPLPTQLHKMGALLCLRLSVSWPRHVLPITHMAKQVQSIFFASSCAARTQMFDPNQKSKTSLRVQPTNSKHYTQQTAIYKRGGEEFTCTLQLKHGTDSPKRIPLLATIPCDASKHLFPLELQSRMQQSKL